eukprot:scaffold244536_cov36-Cyclotella_meneghiniana.AAC.1
MYHSTNSKNTGSQVLIIFSLEAISNTSRETTMSWTRLDWKGHRKKEDEVNCYNITAEIKK